MEEENTTFCGRCAESFRSCGRFLYNSDEGTVLGRTGKSWALIGLFYLIFYSALAGFFAGMLAVFLNTVIEAERPKLTGHQSLLKLTPGLSFFPLPNYKSTLIQFKTKDKLSYAKYTADIDSKLNHIKTSSKKPNDGYAKCDPTADTKKPNDPNEVCKFESKQLGTCMENDYGFKNSKPCIFIKMNKIYGWIPDVQSNITNPYVECRGETKADQEIIGPLKYFPEMEVNNAKYGKISNIFFPYLNQRAYVAPVAAIQFLNLPKNVLVMVRCSLLGLVGQSHSVRLEIVMD